MKQFTLDTLNALTGNLSFRELGAYLCRRLHQICPGNLPVLLWSERRTHMRLWASAGLPADFHAFLQCADMPAAPEPYQAESFGLHERSLLWLTDSDGSRIGALLLYAATTDSALPEPDIIEVGKRFCTVAIQQETQRLQIERIVQFDAMTGLPNAHRLHRHLEQLHQQNTCHYPVSLFVIASDGFPDIPDALGDAIGNEILQQIATRLKTACAPGELLFRIQHDQFALVQSRHGCRQATRQAKRLQQSVRGELQISGHLLHLSVSIGIGHAPHGISDPRLLLSNARQAMHVAQAAGKEGCRFYSRTMRTQAQERLLLGEALRHAIHHGLLSLHYQPQIHTESGMLHGFEALARWPDQNRGNIPPNVFIPLAEEYGLIDTLGYWAMTQACQQLARWRQAGLTIPSMSVNLSASTFDSQKLPGFITHLLDAHGLSGSDLTLEITENATLSFSLTMRQTIRQIQQLGVGLSIDDVGTGFSSLSNLIDLPITEIKINHDFIRQCLTEKRVCTLVSSIIELGRNLGLNVIAEGIETMQQLQWLRTLGCPIAQGFLFAHPMSAQDTSAWLATYAATAAAEHDRL